MTDSENSTKTTHLDAMDLTGSIFIPDDQLGRMVTLVPPPQTISIIASNGTPMVTLHVDESRIEYGPDYRPDEAARLFWDAMQHVAPASKAQQTLEQVAAEVRGMCNCCATNRPHLRRMRELLGMPADDFLANPEGGEG